MSNEVIKEKVNKIKRTLGNRCFFCENELDKELNEKREVNGNGVKWRENVRLIKEIFANRCFFCESNYIPSPNELRENEELGFIFPLCNSSCSQKYKIVKSWQEFNII